MKRQNFILHALFLIVAVLLSQSFGGESVLTLSKSRSASPFGLIAKSNEGSKSLNEKDAAREKNTELALSESRTVVNANQEDFSFEELPDFEYHRAGSLNNKLKTIKTSIVFTKDLSQLSVLII